MWKKTFSKVYQVVTKEQIWKAWSQVNHWPDWDSELEYCDLKSPFIAGSQFILKPMNGPKVKIILSEVVSNKTFTNYCQFIGAKMTHYHEVRDENSGVRITYTITVSGPLAFLWKHWVVKKVAESVPVQTDNLVQYVRSFHA